MTIKKKSTPRKIVIIRENKDSKDSKEEIQKVKKSSSPASSSSSSSPSSPKTIIILSNKERIERKEKIRALEELRVMYGMNGIDKISYTSFDKLEISTMMAIVKLNRKLDLAFLFDNLIVDDLGFEPKKGVKKIKITIKGEPGHILSIRTKIGGELIYRGIDTRTGSFDNCVNIIMSLKEKNVNLKLFENKIQMTGCKNMEQIEEAADLLIKQIIELQPIDNIYIDEEREEEREERENKEDKEELKAYDHFINMQNYSFNLGFKIDRKKLHKLMKKSDYFYSEYDPAMNSAVSIKVPVRNKKGETQYTKSGKIKCVTFRVFETGSVTQSGQDYKKMEKAYDRLRTTIINHQKQLAR